MKTTITAALVAALSTTSVRAAPPSVIKPPSGTANDPGLKHTPPQRGSQMPVVRPTPSLSDLQAQLQARLRDLERSRARVRYPAPASNVQSQLRTLQTQLAAERARNYALQAQVQSLRDQLAKAPRSR